MARAVVRSLRGPTGDFEPAVLYRADGNRLEARARPRSGCDAEAASWIAAAARPWASATGDPKATWEEWVDYALDSLGNGQTSWTAEVDPGASLDEVFAREIGGSSFPQPEPAGPEPVPSGAGEYELVSVTTSFILQVDRQTDRRLYGVPVGDDLEWFHAFPREVGFRLDRIARRVALTYGHPVVGPSGERLEWVAEGGWRFATSAPAADSDGELVAAEYRTPDLAWPVKVDNPTYLQIARDRFAGSLLWGALGDALGRPSEGRSADGIRARFGPAGVTDLHPWHGWRSGPVGTFTDDTQLTIVVAESLVRSGGRFDPDDYVRRLIDWLPEARGIGANTRIAVEALRDGEPWHAVGPRLDSSGNGAAMRSAPIGLLHSIQENPAVMLRDAVRFSLPTHGGRLGVAAAVGMAAATAYCARRATSGGQDLDVDDFLAFVADAMAEIEIAPSPTRRRPVRMHYLRDRVRRVAGWLDRPPEEVFARTYTGAYALESFPAALFCFLRTPDRPHEVLLTAANAGYDTDTIGSMAGNLAGAWVGAQRLEEEERHWWEEIEDRERIVHLADRLLDTALDLADDATASSWMK